MKKFVMSSIFFGLLFVSLNSETITLGEIMNPDSIFVSGDRIYVTEDATIHIYSKNSIKYIGKFGKKGEGPGEINTSRWGGLSFNMSVVNDNVFIHNRSKVMFFEKDGRFIREKKLDGGFIRGLLPVGSNFVARVFKMGENRSRSESLVVYDSQIKKIGEIAGRADIESTRGSFVKIYFDENIFNMETYKNIIYLNNTKDLHIDRFDQNGKKLSSIKVNYPLIKISSGKKSEIRNYYKNESRFKDFWERIKDMFDIADQYPAIKKFFITNNRIYIHTFNRKDEGDEFYILDLNGKVISKKYVPVSINNLIDDYPYFIEGGKFYSLIENEDEEEWELSITNI